MKGKPFPELELIDYLDNVYPLVMPTRGVSEWSGFGMPPIRHWTTRAPFQTGESHWGYAIQPRIINVVMHTRGCDRNDMYDKTAANVQMLSPMTGAMRLRLITSDLRKYELHNVWLTGGYELSTQDQRTPRRQSSGLQLTAYDPIWKWTNSPLDAGETRDADGRTCVATDTFTVYENLVLPFTPPFILGSTADPVTLTCVNDGSVEMSPTISISGPVQIWELTNQTTGHALSWSGRDIYAGETLVIDIPNKSILIDGTEYAGVHLQGDIANFFLTPGSNTIQFQGYGGIISGTTEVAVCWYVEVLGV
jgi:hypothetical protein